MPLSDIFDTLAPTKLNSIESADPVSSPSFILDESNISESTILSKKTSYTPVPHNTPVKATKIETPERYRKFSRLISGASSSLSKLSMDDKEVGLKSSGNNLLALFQASANAKAQDFQDKNSKVVTALIEWRNKKLQSLELNVLIVDDVLVNRKLIERQLSKIIAFPLINVTHAKDGKEALDMFHKAHNAGAPFDLCLTDIDMPIMDGISFIQTVRDFEQAQSLESLEVIFCSARSMQEMGEAFEAARNKSVSSYSKPYPSDLLKQVLHHHIDFIPKEVQGGTLSAKS